MMYFGMAANRSEPRTSRRMPPARAAETGPSEGPRPVSADGGRGRPAPVGDGAAGRLPPRANDGLDWPEVRRDINSRIHELAERWRSEDDVFLFLCECGDPECGETVLLLARAYAEARRKDEVVARAHGAPAAQGTVARG
jgi:hypothetical protein